tara:strand:- start:649 stop:861 length:213 start_codon:yes stop_codon:yes gene_type:complete
MGLVFSAILKEQLSYYKNNDNDINLDDINLYCLMLNAMEKGELNTFFNKYNYLKTNNNNKSDSQCNIKYI